MIFLASAGSVTKNPDGSISVGGQKLPPGTEVETNPDGSVSVKGIVLDIPCRHTSKHLTVFGLTHLFRRSSSRNKDRKK